MDKEIEVLIYGRSSGCAYCDNAKLVCEQNGFAMEFVDMESKGMTKEELSDIVGQPVAKVPQIFVDGAYVGGYTDFVTYLKALNEAE